MFENKKMALCILYIEMTENLIKYIKAFFSECLYL